LGFKGDEGHQVLAGQGMLSRGYPQVYFRLLYTKSLFVIYIQNPSSLILGVKELPLNGQA
jgi:hypothetical protein